MSTAAAIGLTIFFVACIIVAIILIGGYAHQDAAKQDARDHQPPQIKAKEAARAQQRQKLKHSYPITKSNTACPPGMCSGSPNCADRQCPGHPCQQKRGSKA